jgi:GGDEF domain-containing protein
MSEFEMVLSKEFARAARYREPLAILLLEISPTGETLGATRDEVRLCDSVIPIGEKRVGVVLPETSLAGALHVATRLEGILAPPDSTRTGPSLAIGIGIYPAPQATDAPALVRSAESALDQARSGGGGITSR